MKNKIFTVYVIIVNWFLYSHSGFSQTPIEKYINYVQLNECGNDKNTDCLEKDFL